MEFCDDCDSILFLKSIPGEEGEKSKLVYNCKLCSFTKDTSPEDTCIYTRDHSGEYLSYKVLTNPYICEDPTLPILNNIDCPNESCIVNKSETLTKNNIVLSPVYFNNRKDIIEEVEKIMSKSKFNRVIGGEETSTNRDYKIKIDQTSLTLAISHKLKSTTIDKLLDSIRKLDILKDYEIEGKRYVKPERRVTYIKYDKSDMRFIYICTHCNTYWKR